MIKLISPQKPWTHMAHIVDVDEFANKMLVSLIDEEGKFGSQKVMGYQRLTIITELKGQTVPVEITEEGRISQIHPGYTSIDSVSLSIMKMLGHPIQALYNFWLQTESLTAKQTHTCDDGSLIEYAGRRYHWRGLNRGISFATNSVSFEGEIPSSTLLTCKMKTLRDVVDHPAIPKRAIVTGGWSNNGRTTISYDVEDVYTEDLFGEIARHAFMTQGQKFQLNGKTEF